MGVLRCVLRKIQKEISDLLSAAMPAEMLQDPVGNAVIAVALNDSIRQLLQPIHRVAFGGIAVAELRAPAVLSILVLVISCLQCGYDPGGLHGRCSVPQGTADQTAVDRHWCHSGGAGSAEYLNDKSGCLSWQPHLPCGTSVRTCMSATGSGRSNTGYLLKIYIIT